MTGGICGPPQPVYEYKMMPAVGERLCLDIPWAEVYAPDVRDAPFKARVFVTTHRVIAWHAAVDERGRWGEPTLVLEAAHDEPVKRQLGSFYGQLRFDTPAGAVHVTRAGGCGCHSPLGRLQAPVS